jgi:hypothetical protein
MSVQFDTTPGSNCNLIVDKEFNTTTGEGRTPSSGNTWLVAMTHLTRRHEFDAAPALLVEVTWLKMYIDSKQFPQVKACSLCRYTCITIHITLFFKLLLSLFLWEIYQLSFDNFKD